jgi:rsbT antagonist protein RsbS
MPRTIPIIRLYDTLLVSVQVNLSDRLVMELKENLAEELRSKSFLGLIIEVSGVDVFDSYIARSIRDIARIAGLMGTRTVLVGLDPGMAITLVEMDMTMSGVETTLNLEAAFDLLRRHGKESAAADHALLESLTGPRGGPQP